MKDALLAERCRRLRLVLSDVDGVMTDGSVYVLGDGREAKAFHIRDGLGVVMAHRAGLKTGVLSGRRSDATTQPFEIASIARAHSNDCDWSRWRLTSTFDDAMRSYLSLPIR